MFLKITMALKNAWVTVEQYGEAMDGSAYEDVQLYCRHLEGRVAELERRLGCQDIKDRTIQKISELAELH